MISAPDSPPDADAPSREAGFEPHQDSSARQRRSGKSVPISYQIRCLRRSHQVTLDNQIHNNHKQL